MIVKRVELSGSSNQTRFLSNDAVLILLFFIRTFKAYNRRNNLVIVLTLICLITYPEHTESQGSIPKYCQKCETDPHSM